MEATVLVLVVVSPWALGAIDPIFVFGLYTGLALLLALWGLRMVLEWRVHWISCPLVFCLLALILLGWLQVLPLPARILGTVSPATWDFYSKQLPETDLQSPLTLSLYPRASRQTMVELLAVFVLYLVVRNNLTSPRALRRLAIVATWNGALLSLFGILQFFTSSYQTVFWSITTEGKVFGPFVCRNHFAFYVNLCIGLALGLLFCQRSERSGRQSWRDLLQTPTTLWLIAAIALMAAAVVFTLSRGGLIALLSATLVLLLLTWKGRWLPIGSVALLTLAILGWLGTTKLSQRVETIWTQNHDRVLMWTDALGLGWRFPIFGTGYGTFADVQPITNSEPQFAVLIWDHAHNEYLEALVEGGLLRLLITLAALALIFRYGIRAMRVTEGTSYQGLTVGCVFGITTVAVHSIADFGLHIPAITALATVVAAQLVALGHRHEGYELGWGTPLLGISFCGLLASYLVFESWREYRVQANWDRLSRGVNSRLTLFQLLDENTRLAPESALFRFALGQAYLETYKDGLRTSAQQHDVSKHAQLLLALANPSEGAFGPVVAAGVAGSVATVRNETTKEFLNRTLLPDALDQVAHARALTPLNPRIHMKLAEYADRSAKLEPLETHLDRAKRLAPADPELWCQAGVIESSQGHKQEAMASWRHCLTLTDRYLPTILAKAKGSYEPNEILDNMLPRDPGLWLVALNWLYPKGGEDKERHMTRVLEMLASPLDAKGLHVRGAILADLGRPKESIADLEMAVRREPRQVEWRFELAKVLFQDGNYRQARRELIRVLDQAPDHAGAKKLLEDLAAKGVVSS